MWTLLITALCAKQLLSAIKGPNFLPFEKLGRWELKALWV